MSKYENENKTLQSKSRQEVLTRVKAIGESSGLRSGFIEKLFNSIHDESLAFQIALMNPERDRKEKEHKFVL